MNVIDYLATCLDCEPLLPMPFETREQRDDWLRQHKDSTQHHIVKASQFR